MTRRDYVKLAAAFAIVPNFTTTVTTDAGERQAALLAYRESVLNVADVLQADNARFDRKRFLEAAGVVLSSGRIAA